MEFNKTSNNPPPYSEQPGFTPASYYQPPPPGPLLYPPPPQQSTVIIQTTTAMPIGIGPCRITCPSCHAQVLTTVKQQPSSRTHCWALILCLIGCWPCVCLPYCMDSCQDASHYCPNCNAYIGAYSG